jgi:hypothetical protein
MLIETALLETLRAGLAEGEIRPGVDLETLADRLCQVLLHVSLGVFGDEHIAQVVPAIRCRTVLSGVAVDPPPDNALDASDAFAAAEATIDGWEKGDDDAVRIANDSVYGLSGAVYSASLDRALGIARRVRTGSMNVNGGAAYGADVPFGGYKASGVGRQNGVSGFDQYLEVKSVAWPAAAGS